MQAETLRDAAADQGLLLQARARPSDEDNRRVIAAIKYLES